MKIRKKYWIRVIFAEIFKKLDEVLEKLHGNLKKSFRKFLRNLDKL